MHWFEWGECGSDVHQSQLNDPKPQKHLQSARSRANGLFNCAISWPTFAAEWTDSTGHISIIKHSRDTGMPVKLTETLREYGPLPKIS